MTESPEVEVHNAWAIYGLEPDGAVAERPIAMLGRPQDWGDKTRWTYHLYRFTWYTAPDGKVYTNHAHCWTDLKFESPAEYVKLFASFAALMLRPGSPAELCGRDYLDEEDGWSKEWGPMPPVFERPDPDQYWPTNEPITTGENQ